MTIFRLIEILSEVQTKIIYLLASSVLHDPTGISTLKGSTPRSSKYFLDAQSAGMYCFYLMFFFS